MPDGKKARERDVECFFCHVKRPRSKLIEIFDGKYSCSHHNGVDELHAELEAVRRGN